MSTSDPPKPTTLLFPQGLRDALHPYLPPQTRPNTANARPHVTLTYAQSLDGMISLKTGVQTALSGPESKAMTHFLRSVHDAILIGTATACIDDPSLNCRFGESLEAGPVGLESQPVPVILDPARKWTPSFGKIVKLAREKRGRPPLWLVTKLGEVSDTDRSYQDAVEEVGGEVVEISTFTCVQQSKFLSWEAILKVLSSRGLNSVMVEGGARVINGLYSSVNREIVSSVIITHAPKYLGEGGVTVCPKRTEENKEEVGFKDVLWLPLGPDVVMAGRI